jgi:hypothetical protein
VEVADGTSFYFKLIGGFWLVKRFVILCPMILAIFSLPEVHLQSVLCKFISSQIRVYYTYMMHILQQFMQLPVKNFISLFTQEES